MVKGPYRDEAVTKKNIRTDIMNFLYENDKKVSPCLTSIFGIQKRRHKIYLLTGCKIIKVSEGGEGEELVYVCDKKSGEIKYEDIGAFDLAKTYIASLDGKFELRPVVLIEKDGSCFEVISKSVKPLLPDDVKRIEWEKRLSGLDTEKVKEIMEKVIIPKRNLFQRFVCRVFGIK